MNIHTPLSEELGNNQSQHRSLGIGLIPKLTHQIIKLTQKKVIEEFIMKFTWQSSKPKAKYFNKRWIVGLPSALGRCYPKPIGIRQNYAAGVTKEQLAQQGGSCRTVTRPLPSLPLRTRPAPWSWAPAIVLARAGKGCTRLHFCTLSSLTHRTLILFDFFKRIEGFAAVPPSALGPGHRQTNE